MIPPTKVLVLSHSGAIRALAECIRSHTEVVEANDYDQAVDLLRSEQFCAVFSDAADFLPLERALVSQRASLILNTLGEGVCIVDGSGQCNWMNRKMQAWPPRVHETIRRTCQEAFQLFTRQTSSQPAETPPATNRSKRYSLNIDDQQHMEMIASPVIRPGGQVVQIAAVIWDATSTRRLQQKIDAIDGAGRELVQLESAEMSKLSVQARLKLLEEKIIKYTRDLMHFDHFAIRLLDRRTSRLELVISVGLPAESMEVELFASEAPPNGISGYVAATGRSYICPDVERDPRYVAGLDQARSSLTVPLRLNDKVIGVFNIESRQRAAFNEDDRQFAEIFGRYVALALNILDLLVVERAHTSHKVTDNVCAEVAGPLNDIATFATELRDEYIGNDDLRDKLQKILDNANCIRAALRQAAQGPNTVLGAEDVVGEHDPLISNAAILVADDDEKIRTTIRDVLHKYHANVTIAASGGEAISLLNERDFDLIISDIKMPDRTGYDVFAAARRKRTDLPVILMTGFGYDPTHSIVRANQEGLQAVLFKPFQVQSLLEDIRKAIRPRQQA